MAKATHRRAVEIPVGDKLKLRRRAGSVEFFDEKQHKWVAVDTVPSLLDRLRTEGKIDDEEFQAGFRFSRTFEAAGLNAHYGAIAMDAIRVDGGGKWQEPLQGSSIALAEVEAALLHVGRKGALCLVYLIGMDEEVGLFRFRARMHERAVQHVLCGALGSLASFYKADRRHGEGR